MTPNQSLKPKAAFFNQPPPFISGDPLDYVYGEGGRDRIAKMTDLYPTVICEENFDDHVAELDDLEVIFGTWAMPNLRADQVDAMSSLQAVFYAAGSANSFEKTYTRRGVKVFTAEAANAAPVAEFTLAQILLSLKGYFRNAAEAKRIVWRRQQDVIHGPGAYGARVALIGDGQISQTLQRRLDSFDIEQFVVATHQAQERFRLATAFATSMVVSNHLPNLPHLQKVINEDLLARMPQGATFINTGRGDQVDHDDLAVVMARRPDLTTLLDVTDPEPLPADSPLRLLSNVHVSSHIAGAVNDEVGRLADAMIESFEQWCGHSRRRHRPLSDGPQDGNIEKADLLRDTQ